MLSHRLALATTLAAGLLFSAPNALAKRAEGNVIKEVMRDAHKQGLLKKVLGGSASQEEKNKLLSLYIDLYEAKVPAGDANSWLDLTGALMTASAKVAVSREDAADELKAASNCGGCHKPHKKKKLKINAASILGSATHVAAALGAAEPKYSIKEVMKEAHKSGLLKKVNGGDASADEKKKLLDLYVSMWASKPPKGDINSWKKKAGDAIAAAAMVYLGEDGGNEALKKATACGGCHKPHK